MITRIKSDRIIAKDKFVDGYVYFDESGIIDVTVSELPFEKEFDFTGKIVSPGFIDTHIHGGVDVDFYLGSPEEIAKAADYHLSHGTTTIFPTCSAVPFEDMDNFLKNLKACIDNNCSKANIPGAHMEGPYFAVEMCGGQNPDKITEPKPEEYTKLIEDYGDLIIRWSYAPERDENAEFCKYIVDKGIIASIGHSAAKQKDCELAFENGCKLVTHLYSCTSTITREQGYRILGVIETAYLMDDMHVELIADGKHLPPDLIKMIYKIKGEDRIILCTDALKASGSSVTESNEYGVGYIVEDGVCKLPDRSAFAGSIATTDRLIRVCTKDVGISLLSAVKMLTENPAKLYGINAGILEKGRRADIIVFDDDINIQKIFVDGCEI